MSLGVKKKTHDADMSTTWRTCRADMSPTHEHDVVLNARHLTVLASCRDMSPSFRSYIALRNLLGACNSLKTRFASSFLLPLVKFWKEKRPESLAHPVRIILTPFQRSFEIV